jgi:hypothetical protein
MHLLTQRLSQIEAEIVKQHTNHDLIESKLMLDPGNLDLNDEVGLFLFLRFLKSDR